MQIITITGRVGADSEVRTVGQGDKVADIRVAVDQGWGERKSTNWFRCSVWGKRADTIAEHVRKGANVTVVGELTIGEYQGKPQFDVRVNDITWSKVDGAPARETSSQSRGGSGYAPSAEDLDDNVPFITSNIAFEGRVR